MAWLSETLPLKLVLWAAAVLLAKFWKGRALGACSVDSITESLAIR